MAQLQLYLLDRLSVTNGTIRYAAAAPHAARVLGYLALHATNQRTVSRSRIVRVLWPDVEPHEARRTLSGALYRLQQRLGEAVCSSLILRPDAESLTLGPIWVDIDAFAMAARDSNIAQWRAAIDLYSGDLLDDLQDEWLLGARLMLHDLFCHTLARLCVALDQTGEWQTALEYALRWVNADDMNEDAHALVIRLLARLGRTTAAMQQYRRLETMLEREFQSAPQPDIRAFIHGVWAGGRQPDKPRTHPASTPAALRQQAQPTGRITMTQLARLTAPLGRPLAPNECVRVRWTIDAGEPDATILRASGKVALRRQRILRLVAEARAQGAAPTDCDLARALAVTERTVHSDITTLRAQGYTIPTRRRKQ